MQPPDFGGRGLILSFHRFNLVSDACPKGFEHSQNSCYKVNNTKLSRTNAAEACQPGHLVDIRSQDELNFVISLLIRSGGGDAWFGLLKSLSWPDGSSLQPGSWYDIKQDGNSVCFQLDNPSYIWNDVSCEDTNRYVCEYEGKTCYTVLELKTNERTTKQKENKQNKTKNKTKKNQQQQQQQQTFL